MRRQSPDWLHATARRLCGDASADLHIESYLRKLPAKQLIQLGSQMFGDLTGVHRSVLRELFERINRNWRGRASADRTLARRSLR
jgi:hypothetical protein